VPPAPPSIRGSALPILFFFFFGQARRRPRPENRCQGHRRRRPALASHVALCRVIDLRRRATTTEPHRRRPFTPLRTYLSSRSDSPASGIDDPRSHPFPAPSLNQSRDTPAPLSACRAGNAICSADSGVRLGTVRTKRLTEARPEPVERYSRRHASSTSARRGRAGHARRCGPTSPLDESSPAARLRLEPRREDASCRGSREGAAVRRWVDHPCRSDSRDRVESRIGRQESR